MILYSKFFHASTKFLEGEKPHMYPFYCLIQTPWAMRIKQIVNQIEGTAEAILCHLSYVFLFLLVSDHQQLITACCHKTAFLST